MLARFLTIGLLGALGVTSATWFLVGCGVPAGGGDGPTPPEDGSYSVAAPQDGQVEVTESDDGLVEGSSPLFEGRSSGSASLGDQPPAEAGSTTASITAENVHFVSGVEKSAVAARATARWADITVHIAPADADEPCADDFVVLAVTATEDSNEAISLWGTTRANLGEEILQAIAADNFVLCIQVVANFAGSVVVDAVDIAFGAEPPAPDPDGDTNGSEGPCLTIAYMRVLQVGDSWIYDEQRDVTVNGEAVSFIGTLTITVSPDTVVDLAGNTARVILTTTQLVGEDGTELTLTGGEYVSQDPDGTFYKHGLFSEYDPPFERFIQTPAEGRFRTVTSPVTVGDTNEWDVVYDDGTTVIGGNLVVGIESVSVPAGQFVAVKYEASQTETTATTTTSYEFTAWLVPELGLEVRLEVDLTFYDAASGTEIVGHYVRELADTNVPGIETCPDEDGDGLVTICHRPPGNPDNARTITVGINASAAHLAHGDCCGPCP